jgi:Holliday junction DNA helicase RuvB
LLRRVRDFAAVESQGRIDRASAAAALQLLEVDAAGFDPLDRSYLDRLCRQFGGGPVGVEALAASLGEQRDTLEDMVEPFLLQQGYVARTPRGRTALHKAWQHLGLQPPEPSEPQGRLL